MKPTLDHHASAQTIGVSFETGVKVMQNVKKSFVGVAVVGALAFSPLLMAQTSSGAAVPSKQDTAFVAKASAANMTEVEASKLADSRAKSDAVKAFAARMIADHTKAGEELSSVSQKDGFTPSASPMLAQQKAIAKLEPLNGAAFDKAYSSMMLKDHVGAVALFKKEAATGKNDDLKSFAKQTLPTLQDHLAMAKKLR
jgi:putative membrane protein